MPATSTQDETITIPRSEFDALRADVARLLTLIESRESRVIPDHPMSVAEVAKIVGKNEKTVRRWIERRKLVAKTEGRTTMIRPVDLQRFLEGKKQS